MKDDVIITELKNGERQIDFSDYKKKSYIAVVQNRFCDETESYDLNGVEIPCSQEFIPLYDLICIWIKK